MNTHTVTYIHAYIYKCIRMLTERKHTVEEGTPNETTQPLTGQAQA